MKSLVSDWWFAKVLAGVPGSAPLFAVVGWVLRLRLLELAL